MRLRIPRRQLTKDEHDACCRFICFFGGIMVFVCFLGAILVSLFSGPNYPTFWVDEFYVTPLNKTTTDKSTTQNHTLINFVLKIHYHDDVAGSDVYYEHLNLTFSFLPNITATTSVFLGNYSVPTLHQGNKRDIFVKDVVETDGYMLDEKRLMIVASRKLKEDDILVLNKPITKVFRVDLVAQWRYKYKGASDLMRVVGAAVVKVNDQTGKKVNKKGIQLITNQFPDRKITVVRN